jgi:protein-S-isoprenylcysteine O-methyltransferase Ste14
MSYGAVILAGWALFLLVWSIKGGGISSLWYRYWPLRLAVAAFVVFEILRIATGTAHYTEANSAIFRNGIFTPPFVLGWVAAALTALGILFAIWARIHLGRNWSAAPAVKEHHELVTSGPYRFVRHPICTGVILAVFGSALTGTLFSIGVFIVVCIIFHLRVNKEERIMLELFPDTYPAYQAATKKLIPFVW